MLLECRKLPWLLADTITVWCIPQHKQILIPHKTQGKHVYIFTGFLSHRYMFKGLPVIKLGFPASLWW